METSSLLGYTKKSERIEKRVQRIAISVCAVLSILFLLIVNSVFASPSANAINWFDPGEAVEKTVKQTFCNNAAFGLKSQDVGFMNNGSAPKGSNPTMYEKYGMSGMNYSTFTGFDTVDKSITSNGGRGLGGSESVIAKMGGDAQEIGLDKWEKPLRDNQYSGLNNYEQKCGTLNTDTLMSVLANGFLWGAQATTWTGNTAFEMVGTVSDSLWSKMEPNFTKIANTLWDNLYFAYMLPMISIAALVMFYQGAVKRQVLSFFQSLIWLIVVIVSSAILSFKPMLLPQMISDISGNAGQFIISKVNKIGADDNTGLCYADGKNKAVREFQCTQYVSFVYEPWVRGQFGVGAQELSKKGDFASYVGKNTINKEIPLSTLRTTNGDQMNIINVKFGNRTPVDQSWALYYLDYKSNWDNAPSRQKVDKVRAQMHVFGNQLGSENPNRDFSGENGIDRLMSAFVGSGTSTSALILILVISLEILILDFYIMVMGMFLPLFALAALHPTQGRKTAVGFLETLLKYGLRRLILAVYLAVAVLVIRTFALNPDSNVLVQMIIMIVIVVVMLKLKGLITAMFNKFTFTGLPEGAPEPNVDGVKRAFGGVAKGAGSALLGAGIGGALASKNAKSTLKTAASKVAGAGKTPQGKDFGKSTMGTAKTIGINNRKAQREEKLKMSQPSRNREQVVNEDSLQDETSFNDHKDSSGAGVEPQHNEAPQFSETSNESHENESIQDASGSGQAPQGTQVESDTETPFAPLTAKQQKQEAKATTKRIAQELKSNGYREGVGMGTILGATIKGAYVGATTGSVRSAVSASTSTVNRKKQAIQQANAQVVKNVSQQERNRSYEIARQQRQSEFEKAQAKRKAEREANMKRNADARAKRYAGNPNQQGKTQQQNPTAQAPQQNSAGQAPQQKPASQEPARKVTYESQAPAPQVSNPATPNVEAPRYETPVRETPTPSPQVSNPANYASEVQAPRVEQPRVETPRNATPAPQPVREARNENPRVEQLRNPAPQPVRETPKVEQPKVETPKYSPPAPQPVRETPKVETPRTPKPVIQPRKSTPAPKPVVKESKPKVSNPKPPAPPVKAPAPKAKVNPPKAQAPQPPLPSRKSLRESGNQTPPAPKPPQPRNR